MHKSRSPRKQGRGNHAIGNRPESASAAWPRFPPAPTQNWAYQAGTRGFIGVPFRGFLAPPSETDDLTRILRRRLAFVSIAQPMKICNHFCIYNVNIHAPRPSFYVLLTDIAEFPSSLTQQKTGREVLRSRSVYFFRSVMASASVQRNSVLPCHLQALKASFALSV